MNMSLLEVKNLKTYFFTPFGKVKAVDDISFTMKKGASLGLAGESGCGKTTTAYSLINLVPLPGRIIGGEINFKGEDILQYNDKQTKDLRWKEISMVFQGAMASLNPLFKIGNQIAEPIIYHEQIDKNDAMDRARELLELVGIEQSRVDRASNRSQSSGHHRFQTVRWRYRSAFPRVFNGRRGTVAT